MCDVFVHFSTFLLIVLYPKNTFRMGEEKGLVQMLEKNIKYS